jgi:hypothetical protein
LRRAASSGESPGSGKAKPTILCCFGDVEGPGALVTIDAEDSIENLSKTFGFEIIADDKWALRDLKGRKVIFGKHGETYKFNSLKNQNQRTFLMYNFPYKSY